MTEENKINDQTLTEDLTKADVFKKNLEKYAQLLVKNGINIQKNQTLVVNAPIEAADFVKVIAKAAYASGAKNVHVEYRDEQLSLIKFLNAPDEAFDEAPKWKADGFAQMAEDDAAFLSITGSDPQLLKDADPSKVARANKANSMAMAKFRRYTMNSDVSWCVAAVSNDRWAEKVFPHVSSDQAEIMLWDKIFMANRVYTNDPVKAWEDHIKVLNEKMDFLNRMQFKSLHYKSPLTDLTVELPKGHIWAGGGEDTTKGVYFIANMPTEEVFTLPLKTGVNGYVASTLPLNYSGNTIDGFVLTFQDGKVVDMKAEKGYDTLKKLIETDEGSAYLGEVALVPYDSPVSNSKTIFLNTLFDENASCHFALGAAYPKSIKGGDKMTDEELEKIGVNTSLSHVDFMIGSSDMDIKAYTEDGREYQIFKDGNWAF